MARGFNYGMNGFNGRPNPGLEPAKAPEDVSGIFRSKSRSLYPAAAGITSGAAPVPPPIPSPAPGPVPSAAVPSFQQLGGMLNGLVGNVFENNNWWLWAALLIIFFNPDLRKKLFGKLKQAD